MTLVVCKDKSPRLRPSHPHSAEPIWRAIDALAWLKRPSVWRRR